MKKVLVFGASGSIGGSIVAKFASENCDVFPVFRTDIGENKSVKL